MNLKLFKRIGVIFFFSIVTLNSFSQIWNKIGSFVDYHNTLPGLESVKCIDYDNSNNSLYISYFNETFSLVVKKFDGSVWQDISPNPIINNLVIPKMSLKTNSGNAYILLCDRLLKYDGLVWTEITLPNISTDNTVELELAVNPLNNNISLARLVARYNVGDVLRIDELNGSSLNLISEVVVSFSNHTYGAPDYLSFCYQQNGSAIVSISLIGINSTFNIYELQSGILTAIPNTISITSGFNLFYNYATSKINLITSESKLYEINNSLYQIVHSFSSSLYVPTALVDNTNTTIVFSGTGTSNAHEVNLLDVNYNMTPLDQSNFNLIEEVLYSYDRTNGKFFVLGWNDTASTTANFPELELAVFEKLNSITKIKENTANTAISIYPNPVSDKLIINSSQTSIVNFNYTITNSIGQVVMFGKIDLSNSILLNNLNNGIYNIVLKDKNNLITTNKFILNN